MESRCQIIATDLFTSNNRAQGLNIWQNAQASKLQMAFPWYTNAKCLSLPLSRFVFRKILWMMRFTMRPCKCSHQHRDTSVAEEAAGAALMQSFGCCKIGTHHYTDKSFHSAGSLRKEEETGSGNVIFQSPVL